MELKFCLTFVHFISNHVLMLNKWKQIIIWKNIDHDFSQQKWASNRNRK